MRRSSNLASPRSRRRHAQTLLITNKVSRISEPLPKDPNQLAYKIVQLSTEEPEQPKERDPVKEYLSLIGKRGGLKGGPARAKKLSAKRRKKIAKEAAQSRWREKGK